MSSHINLPAAALNADFETEFELDSTSGSTLKIHHRGEANREKITHDQIRNTGFSAKLAAVQYGTYECEQLDGTFKPEPAALLLFAFDFRFKKESRDRFVSATITLEFEETSNVKFEPPLDKNVNFETPLDRNPQNDPQVKFIAPYQICGNPSTEDIKRHWNLEGRLGYQIPGGPDLGVKPAVDTEVQFQKHHRMWIEGQMDSDDDHRYDNRVIWDIQENKVERTGIPRHLEAVAVIVLPKAPEYFVKVKVVVTPCVAFSLNPLRLRQKQDDPILLDRKTAKGTPFELGRDFSDPEYPWSTIIKMPTEYENILHS